MQIPIRAPCIYGFLKDLAALASAFPSKYRTSPRIYGFLKDLAILHHAFSGENRAFPSKYRAAPCIPGFLKDLGQVSTRFTGMPNHGDSTQFDLSFHLDLHGSFHGGAARFAAVTLDAVRGWN